MVTLRPIPTTYQGTTFRSRLEAEWALNLDVLGIAWIYEPEGFTLPSGANYLPDFWLPGINTWLEVKGPGVGGLEKFIEFATPEPWEDGWRHADHGYVLGGPSVAGRFTFQITCRWCAELISSTAMVVDQKAAEIRFRCYRGHGTQFVSSHYDGCGMESRCQVCAEKVTNWTGDGSDQPLWSVPSWKRLAQWTPR